MSRVFNNVAASSPNKIGAITWQYTLLPNHLKLGGGINNFSVQYEELFHFFKSNNLLASTIEIYNSNTALGYYDEAEDKMTMPNFIDKTIWGGNGEVSVKEAGLPNITGRIESYRFLMTNNNNDLNTSNLKGAFYYNNQSMYHNEGTQGTGNNSQFQRIDGVSFDASRSNSIYNNSTTVQPPAITLIPQIRFSRDGADTGSIITFVGTKIPNGYLSCDGSVYDIDLYKDLADFILDQFGSYNHFGGDGITTFGVPNLNSSSPVINCIKF